MRIIQQKKKMQHNGTMDTGKGKSWGQLNTPKIQITPSNLGQNSNYIKGLVSNITFSQHTFCRKSPPAS